MSDTGVQVKRRRPRHFAQVPHLLARDGSLSDKAFRLWVVLESHADFSDRDARLTMGRLAEECGCSVRTVLRVQSELIDRSLLEIESGRAAGVSNVYTVLDPVDMQQGGYDTHVVGGYDTDDVPPTTPVSYPLRHPCRTEQETSEQETSEREGDASLVATLGGKIKSDASLVERLCSHLADRVEEFQEARPVMTVKGWYEPMDLLLRRGPLHESKPAAVAPERIVAAIDFVFTVLAEPQGRDGFCWADQIRSARALRDHWLQLLQAGRRAQRVASRDPLRQDSQSVERKLLDIDPLGRSQAPLLLKGTA